MSSAAIGWSRRKVVRARFTPLWRKPGTPIRRHGRHSQTFLRDFTLCDHRRHRPLARLRSKCYSVSTRLWPIDDRVWSCWNQCRPYCCEWDCARCWCGPRMSIVVVCCLCFSCTLLMWLLLITACQNNHLYCHLPGRSLVWKSYKSLEWHQKVSADVQKVWGHLWNVGGLLVLGKVVHFEISNSKTASHQKCGRVFQCWKRCLSADLGAGILAATWHEKIFFSSRWL